MAKIDKIRYIGKEDVYNMEVFGLHNFVTALGTVLHNCRAFIVSRTRAAEAQRRANELEGEDEADTKMDYEEVMCGGEPTASYIGGM